MGRMATRSPTQMTSPEARSRFIRPRSWQVTTPFSV